MWVAAESCTADDGPDTTPCGHGAEAAASVPLTARLPIAAASVLTAHLAIKKAARHDGHDDSRE
jgi:hypothetical protein